LKFLFPTYNIESGLCSVSRLTRKLACNSQVCSTIEILIARFVCSTIPGHITAWVDRRRQKDKRIDIHSQKRIFHSYMGWICGVRVKDNTVYIFYNLYTVMHGR
jgi:hypothetical protein